jgi:hypothetical protein
MSRLHSTSDERFDSYDVKAEMELLVCSRRVLSSKWAHPESPVVLHIITEQESIEFCRCLSSVYLFQSVLLAAEVYMLLNLNTHTEASNRAPQGNNVRGLPGKAGMREGKFMHLLEQI